MTSHGLRVRNPQMPGCCAEQPTAGDTISCRQRGEENDDGTYFFTSWGEPIAPADRIADAKTAVLKYLGCCPEETAGAER